MRYSVFILRRAQKEMAALPLEVYPRVRDAIRDLADDPRPPGVRKLAGRDGWRLRVGDYRVIYDVDDESRRITVLHIGHRRDVYR
ncbi:MAG: type II toxin-antitoxin system RelE/ParE family toxin [Firmicutes bacterium]|uniref:type II toxin-antitoxin system RelE family toxin n=1 Tax=Geochorda subterranea TaxID=3109564 RepID=UPI0016AF5E65|nr:type II toxin-antitoxin system RelE/ParE family toxin [Bacillota bacterium]